MHFESPIHPNETVTPASPHALIGRVPTLQPPETPPAATDEHQEQNTLSNSWTQTNIIGYISTAGTTKITAFGEFGVNSS
jgi:hypothetical protein